MQPYNKYVPVLAIKSGIYDIGFYQKAFGAVLLWRLDNANGSVHVAAFEIDGAVFRLHEQSSKSVSPDEARGTTVTIGLTADDVHGVMEQAILAGATEVSPVNDYEYGYRQGEIRDPFGHHWLIEKLFNKEALNDFVKKHD